jgi:hypothetical protein
MGVEVKRLVIVSWAVVGVAALLAEPIVRLGCYVMARLQHGLPPREWASVVVAILVLGYLEGYRGFRCSFGPRIVERAFALAAAPRVLYVVLAPLHAMSLIGDSRTRVARAWGLVVAIVLMIGAVRHLPASARCSVDAGVAASLLWGLVEIMVRFVMRLLGDVRGVAPGTPRLSLAAPPQ